MKKLILLTSFTLLFLSCQKSEKTAAETSDPPKNLGNQKRYGGFNGRDDG